MLLYIDNAVRELRASGAEVRVGDLRAATVHGALQRLRPKVMTVMVIVAGLLPVMFSDGAGSDVMKRIAAPLVGGMLTAPRSEEHTSELQSLMRISYAAFCLKIKNTLIQPCVHYCTLTLD